MIENKHLSGAAIDVFPQEPQDNSMPFNSKLMEFDNVLLTPHIGGSTKEAQHNIAIEVSSKIVDYLKFGITQGAVNFPNVNLAKQHNRIRISHIHHNVPGMLEKINFVIAKYSLNVASQMLQTEGKIGFVLLDLDLLEIDQSIINELQEINHTIAVRICNA
jgi:D-3-phosphoglycerate dehydrogenase